MRNLTAGDLVRSIKGRDSGKLLFVVGFDGKMALLVNGKERPVERPKQKKTRHLEYVVSPEGRVPEKLKNGERVGNSEIRKAIAAAGNELLSP